MAVLVTQEDGHHGGRRFVGAQTVVVAGGGHGQPQQILIVVHGLYHRAQEQQELRVLVGCLAGSQQVHAGIGGHGPVVVLTGAVDAVEGLFVQQAHQPVPGGHLLHDLHGQLVVVGGDICSGIDGRQLVLGGSHLVVLRLGQNAQLPQLLVQILHERADALPDDAEILIVQLLPLGRGRAEQGAAAEDQILPLVEHLPIHQEILLLRANGGSDTLHVLVAEQVQHPQGLLVQRLHGAQQRRLFVQRFAAVGTEGRGDAQRLVLDKGVGRGIPGRVAASLKRGAQTAGGEAGRVRLALDQLLAGELHKHTAVRRGGDKAVVLLGGDAGQRLEPMGKMSRSMLDGPILHGLCHGVGHLTVQPAALVNGLFQRQIDVMGEPCLHHAVIKYQCAEDVRYGFHVFHPVFNKFENRKRRHEALSFKTPLPFMGEIIGACERFVNQLFSQFLSFYSLTL